MFIIESVSSWEAAGGGGIEQKVNKLELLTVQVSGGGIGKTCHYTKLFTTALLKICFSDKILQGFFNIVVALNKCN